jgi:hypothetical protein
MNFGKAQTELMDEHAIEIHRLYVLEEYQSKKARCILVVKCLVRVLQSAWILC